MRRAEQELLSKRIALLVANVLELVLSMVERLLSSTTRKRKAILNAISAMEGR